MMTFISKKPFHSLAFLHDYLCWIPVTYFELSVNMGKKLIGEKALTEAGKQRWYRQKLSAARKAKIATEVKE